MTVHYSYGAKNLRTQFGKHVIVNNQYGRAGYRLCTRYSGRGSCNGPITTGGYATYNLTPINSIVLTKPSTSTSPPPCPAQGDLVEPRPPGQDLQGGLVEEGQPGQRGIPCSR